MPFRATSVAAALLVAAAPVLAASRFDPARRFRTWTTEHFVIYFHDGEQALALRLATIAERTYGEMRASLGVPAQRRTHVVLADQSDLSNGYASPFPYNTIVLYPAWPSGSAAIGNVDDWLRVVFTHEFVHLIHLDRSGGYARVIRRIFGRTPLAFPNLFLPLWQIEGLATFAEGAATGVGRPFAGDFRAIERAAARAARAEPLDRVGGGLTSWPDGIAPYAYGLGFHEYLAAQYGADRFAALADKTARRVPYLAAGAYPQIFGKPLHELWREYQASLVAGASASPRLAGARLTRHGFNVAGPRFAPPACDGCPPEIVYSVATPHGFPALNAIALDGAEPRQLATRYLGSTVGVGREVIVFDQQELQRNVALHGDLYAFDRQSGDVRRLTHGSRLLDPDLSPDGSTIVAVRERLGRRELVTVTHENGGSGFSRTIDVLFSESDTQFNAPRWSPAGGMIAAERHRPGGASEIVLVDTATRRLQVIASNPKVRYATPAWRPDAGAIVVAAAPAGQPFNLVELRFTGDSAVRARPLTETTGGATWPDVSPDGKTLVFVGYTPDGFDLFSMPYPPMPSASDSGVVVAQADPPPWPDTTPPPAAPEPYSPLRTLRPMSWTPVVEIDGDAVRLGAATGGSDVLGYHGYGTSATWRVGAAPAPAALPRVDWNALYVYDRWRSTWFVAASSDSTADAELVVRSTEAEAGVQFPIRKVRIAHRAIASVVRLVDRYDDGSKQERVNRSALRLAWATASARFYGFSISPEHGVTIGGTSEIARRALDASGNATTVTVDARAYLQGFGRHHVLALRAGGGVSNGDERLRRRFVLGGASSDPGVVAFGADAFSLLRGFEDAAFVGSRVAVLNADYRWPLARPERGFRSWPVFLHTVHAALIADAGHTWTRRFRLDDLKTAIGAELSAELVVGYSLRLTLTAGTAWGRDGARGGGGSSVYVRAGRAF